MEERETKSDETNIKIQKDPPALCTRLDTLYCTGQQSRHGLRVGRDFEYPKGSPMGERIPDGSIRRISGETTDKGRALVAGI